MPYKEGKKWRGKVKRKGKVYTKFFKTKGEALAWETEKRKSLKSEKSSMTHLASLHEAGTEYLQYCQTLQFNQTTILDKRKAIKDLIAMVDNIGIDEVQPGQILNFIMAQNTPQLANKRRKDLSTFFDHCVRFLSLPFNPVLGIQKIPIERKSQPVATEAEFLKLLMVAPRHDRNFLVVLGGTGARRSEILRLTWSQDIDFDKRAVRLGSRKNRSRQMKYRWVEVDEIAWKALMDQYKTRLPTSDYVFQNRDPRHPNYGDRYTARRKLMQGLCKRAKISKPIRFHALRRYFASLRAEEGESLPQIQAALGHANISTTDLYIQRIRHDQRSVKSKVRSKPKIMNSKRGT